MKMPRGIRNNNPGNIRRSTDAWKGLAPEQTDEAFAVFTEPKWGLRAMSRLLQTYSEVHKLHTLAEIIDRWAPPAENDTHSYITAVSIWSDIEPEENIDMMDYGTMLRLMKGMVRMENGKPPEGTEPAWYPDNVYEQGLRLAGVSPNKGYTESRTTVSTGTGIVASSTAVGVLTDLLNLPDWVADLLPQALTGFTDQQIAVGILLIVGLTQWRTIAARIDDKLKGRL